MASSTPLTYNISDFLEWKEKDQLVLDPEFQRGSVWTPPANTFLIDTILKGFPIPQIFLRTSIDVESKKTIREVVDGQQRLRAIFSFANNELRLTSRSKDFVGMRYADLADEQKGAFLSYSISVVQLINADNADILEIFARLNSYGVKVTPAELRHAKYSEPVKWYIWDATRRWSVLWDRYRLVSVREAVRLKNNSFIADLFISVDQGLSDGGEPQIDRYYANHQDKDEAYFDRIDQKLDNILQFMVDRLAPTFYQTTFFDAPNFLILFNVIGFLGGDIPVNQVTEQYRKFAGGGVNPERLDNVLRSIAAAVSNREADGPHGRFVLETRSTTQRRASRLARFGHILERLAE